MSLVDQGLRIKLCTRYTYKIMVILKELRKEMHDYAKNYIEFKLVKKNSENWIQGHEYRFHVYVRNTGPLEVRNLMLHIEALEENEIEFYRETPTEIKVKGTMITPPLRIRLKPMMLTRGTLDPEFGWVKLFGKFTFKANTDTENQGILEIHELIKAWVFIYDLSFYYSLVEETIEEPDAEGVLSAAVYDN
jgi:hypothetical protein